MEQTSDFVVATRAALAQLSALAVQYSFAVIGAVVLLILGWIAARMLSNWAHSGLSRIHGIDATLAQFFSNIVRYVVLILVIVMVLGQFGVQTASILAALGAIGLAVGLALQGTLQNIAAGIMLLVLRPFRVGETIETSSVTGTVVGTCRSPITAGAEPAATRFRCISAQTRTSARHRHGFSTLPATTSGCWMIPPRPPSLRNSTPAARKSHFDTGQKAAIGGMPAATCRRRSSSPSTSDRKRFQTLRQIRAALPVRADLRLLTVRTNRRQRGPEGKDAPGLALRGGRAWCAKSSKDKFSNLGSSLKRR